MEILKLSLSNVELGGDGNPTPYGLLIGIIADITLGSVNAPSAIVLKEAAVIWVTEDLLHGFQKVFRKRKDKVEFRDFYGEFHGYIERAGSGAVSVVFSPGGTLEIGPDNIGTWICELQRQVYILLENALPQLTTDPSFAKSRNYHQSIVKEILEKLENK
ncbi:MAG: hypothetical protein ACNA8W_08300 [Bradymonadaceae bacterium]